MAAITNVTEPNVARTNDAKINAVWTNFAKISTSKTVTRSNVS